MLQTTDSANRAVLTPLSFRYALFFVVDAITKTNAVSEQQWRVLFKYEAYKSSRGKTGVGTIFVKPDLRLKSTPV